MTFARPVIDEVMPSEYRNIADKLYSSTRDGASSDALRAAAADFAAALGMGKEYASAVSAPTAEELARAERRLLGHFRNNLELLIQKTWIEKADETHREKLLDRVPSFVADIESGDEARALKTFAHIVDELAYLLFGAQSRKADFIEYCFRIDAQLGLFWWYAGTLSGMLGERDPQRIKAVLLVGVCFLAGL